VHHVLSPSGTKVRYSVTGSGPPLVIVPGSLAPPAMYQPLADSLAHHYRVHLVARRGYGSDGPGSRPYRIVDQVADLAAVLGELDEPAVLFGHSFGGVIGLALTASLPAQVRGLALYEPPVTMLGHAMTPMLRRCGELLAEGRPMDVVRTAFRLSGLPEFADGALPERIASGLMAVVPGLMADLECATTMTISAEWTSIAVPVLLMRGEPAAADYLRGLALVQLLLPASTCAVLPGQAHFPHDFDQVAKLISDWAS